MTTFRRPTWAVTVLLLSCTSYDHGRFLEVAAAEPELAGASSGGGGVTGDAGADASGGVDGTEDGELGGSGPTSCDANAGAGGEPEPVVCDEACLDSVVSQTSDFGMQLESSWFLVGCHDKQGHDCLNMANGVCPNRESAVDFNTVGNVTTETFPIGGIPGRNYKITFTFDAVASAREIEGGSRDAGQLELPDPNHALWDAFHRDGAPKPSNYEAWQLTVFDETGAEARHYFMNSFPLGKQYERHAVFLLSYVKSIVVVGGGKVTYRIQDPNCHAIDNCDPNLVTEGCYYPRFLPNEPPDVALPEQYLDPVDQTLKPITELSELNPTPTQPWHAQLGHLLITKVEETTDPVTHDYL